MRVIVGDSGRFPQYWARTEGLVGEEVDAVEVKQDGGVFYVLDSERQGTAKVTTGRGSALVGHRSLDIERVIGDA